MGIDSHISRGQTGQALAEAFLLARGLRCVSRNYRTRFGEIDLVMEDRGMLVFVEVKARRSERRGTALEAVTPAKQRQLTRLALAYLQKETREMRRSRFDVIAIRLSEPPEIRWITGAFEACR